MADFTSKKCEDIVTDMIKNDVVALQDINKDILYLESVQDKLLEQRYGLEKADRDAAHKAVSLILRHLYQAHEYAEQKIYGKALAVVECEK